MVGSQNKNGSGGSVDVHQIVGYHYFDHRQSLVTLGGGSLDRSGLVWWASA